MLSSSAKARGRARASTGTRAAPEKEREKSRALAGRAAVAFFSQSASRLRLTRALAGLCVRVSRLADRADPKPWVPNVRRRTLLSAAPKDAAEPATRARRRSTRFAFLQKARYSSKHTRPSLSRSTSPKHTRTSSSASASRAWHERTSTPASSSGVSNPSPSTSPLSKSSARGRESAASSASDSGAAEEKLRAGGKDSRADTTGFGLWALFERFDDRNDRSSSEARTPFR